MENKVSFTKQELTDFLDEWIGYIVQDIKEFGLPEQYVNHPFHCTFDFVDSYFESYFQPERSKREDSSSLMMRCGALNTMET